MTACGRRSRNRVHILLKVSWIPYDVLTKALVEGMRIVGDRFP